MSELENKSENTTNTITPIEPKGTMETSWELLKFTGPFTISRAAVAVNVIANGLVTPHISPSAAAAGPLMITIAYAVIGPGRAILISSGIVAGEAKGELDKIDVKDLAAKARKEKDIGSITRQSLLLGGMVAIPSALIFAGMGPFLSSIGIDAEIVKSTTHFLNYTSIGLPAIYFSTSDQQFCLAIGRKELPLKFGTLFPLLSMAIGYPLAFGIKDIIPAMDTGGLGLGMSLAAWISCIALRLHFNREEFNRYALYEFRNTPIFKGFSKLLKLGVPLGLQALSEWLNMFLLSTLVGLDGKEAAEAANASFQVLTAVNLIMAAVGQASGVKLSRLLGQLKDLDPSKDSRAIQAITHQAKKIGCGAVTLSSIGGAILSIVLIGLSAIIVPLFVSDQAEAYHTVTRLGQWMLIFNAIALFIDNISNNAASVLSGSKDVKYAPIMRFLFMSVLALTVGGILSEETDLSVNVLFVSRAIGILLATLPILQRLFSKDYEAEFKAQGQAKPLLADRDRFFMSTATAPSTPPGTAPTGNIENPQVDEGSGASIGLSSGVIK